MHVPDIANFEHWINMRMQHADAYKVYQMLLREPVDGGVVEQKNMKKF